MSEPLFTLARAARILRIDDERLCEVVAAGVPMRHTTEAGEPAFVWGDLLDLRACGPILRGALHGEPLRSALGAAPAAHPRGLAKVVVLRDPKRSAAEAAKGRRAERRGHVVAAENHYRRALKICGTNAQAWTGLGRLCAAAGYTDEALQLFARAVSYAPEDAEPVFEMGIIFAAQGDHATAAAALARAAGFDPEHADAHHHLAVSLVALGELERARVHAAKALSLHPQATWAPVARTILTETRS